MAECWVVVADSARARIFDADSGTHGMREIAGLVHGESRARNQELTSDREGRAFDRVGRGRHAMAAHISPHKHEADVFARHIAERLAVGCVRDEFKHLRLCAPPAFLGMLHKHLDNNVRATLEKTVAKNLIQETPEVITAQLFDSSKPSNSALD